MTTLTCPLCQEAGEVISTHHRDPRQCGFDTNGQFNPGNYCCVTLLTLRQLAHDHHFVRYGVDEFQDYRFFETTLDDGRHLSLRWYKERGRTEEACLDHQPITLSQAVVVLQKLLGRYPLRKNPTMSKADVLRVSEKLARNSTVGATTNFLPGIH